MLLTPASKWLLLSPALERRQIYTPRELLVQQKDKGSIITELIYGDENQLRRDNQMCFSAQNGPRLQRCKPGCFTGNAAKTKNKTHQQVLTRRAPVGIHCWVFRGLTDSVARFLSAPDNPSLLSHVPVTVQVLDVNDNPPEVATDGEVIVCESSRPGQVSIQDSSVISVILLKG